MPDLTWTSEPIQPGWYLWRRRCDPRLPWALMMSRPRKVYVHNLMGLLFVDGHGPVCCLSGEWSPIKEHFSCPT